MQRARGLLLNGTAAAALAAFAAQLSAEGWPLLATEATTWGECCLAGAVLPAWAIRVVAMAAQTRRDTLPCAAPEVARG